jgi:hypothetical protein
MNTLADQLVADVEFALAVWTGNDQWSPRFQARIVLFYQLASEMPQHLICLPVLKR